MGEAPETLKREPARFDAEGLAVAQHWANSADGTPIPYFEVSRSRDFATDATATTTATAEPRPALLYGYGGFEVAETPHYLPTAGAGWLEPGGVYAVANIRGGVEFGPPWHRAALKAGRRRAFEDFIAVAEDLVDRGVTTTCRLGILGGSNGGLLMGNMLTMRPDLFGAVVARVPLFGRMVSSVTCRSPRARDGVAGSMDIAMRAAQRVDVRARTDRTPRDDHTNIPPTTGSAGCSAYPFPPKFRFRCPPCGTEPEGYGLGRLRSHDAHGVGRRRHHVPYTQAP